MHDSYRVRGTDFAAIFTSGGSSSIRGSSIDCVALGLYYKQSSAREHLLTSGFDGVATYFASDGFTEGARTGSWADIGTWAASEGLVFAPAVAPGHDDLKIRPWNKLWRRDRGKEHGAYYAKMWQAAMNADAGAVLINSFNDWITGTQIEPASNEVDGTYSSYAPQEPDFYIQETAKHAKAFAKAKLAAHGDEL